MRSLTCGRLRSLIFGAFAAGRAGADAGRARRGDQHRQHGRREPPHRASAASRPSRPSSAAAAACRTATAPTASGADAAYLKNSPIEITEAEAPARILRYGLMPDTGGPGAHRGGMAQVLEFCATAPDAFVTARNRDRTLFQPWGVLGGRPGASGSFTLNPGTDRERDLGNTDALRLGQGDVLRIVSPGGGGRGDPFTRDPAAVLRDVQAGLVTPEGARRDYGVVHREWRGGCGGNRRPARASKPAPPGFRPRPVPRRRTRRAGPSRPMPPCTRFSPRCRSPGARRSRPCCSPPCRDAPDQPAEEVIQRAFAAYVARSAEAAE